VALVPPDGGSSLRWRAVFAAVLPVYAEAQASSSSSRVLQQGEEDGEKLTVVLLSRPPDVVADAASLSSHLCFAVLCLFLLYFVSPVNSVLASMQWLRGGGAGASGAAGCGEDEDGWW